MATRILIPKLTSTISWLSAIGLFKTSSVFSRVIKQKSFLFTNAPELYLNSINSTKHYSTIGENNIPIVTYEDIKKLTEQSTQLLIDVREPKELQETGKIESSINIPLSEVEQELGPAVDKAAFKVKYGRDKPEKDSEIIFHCRSGKRSQQAAECAKSLGYQHSKNYLGSWLEWADKEGLPK